MITRFRRRFMLITMLLVGVVSLAAFTAVGILYYQSQRGPILNDLTAAVTGDDMEQSPLDSSNRLRRGDAQSYIVIVDAAGNLIQDNANFAELLETSPAIASAWVTEALSSAASFDQLPEYGVFFEKQLITNGLYMGGYRIAFISSTNFDESIGPFLLWLLGFWLSLMAALFVIVFFLSRYVTKPVEQAWNQQQRFIADASHELKTPLTVIMADASILADNPDKTVREQSAWVQGISSEAERMQVLTEDMLTLALADAGAGVEPMMSDVDLSKIVDGAILQFEAVAFERGMVIEDDVDSGIHIVGDAARMDRVLKTLIENACKYGESPGSISVTLKSQKGQAVLSIHNTGQPIPREDLPHLFERFYRSDKARTTYEGESASFGLGLSIAKAAVESHRGSISVSSDESGTTFVVRIPLAK